MELPDDQHPRVRTMTYCIRCMGDKDQGLVLCWTCHGALKREHGGGYGAWQELLLQAQESTLKSLGVPKWEAT